MKQVKWFDKLKKKPKSPIIKIKDNEKSEIGLPKLKRVFGKFKG